VAAPTPVGAPVYDFNLSDKMVAGATKAFALGATARGCPERSYVCSCMSKQQHSPPAIKHDKPGCSTQDRFHHAAILQSKTRL